MIELKDIKKSYLSGENEALVLKGISFSVKKGEFVAIMGPSGSGKSTLMNIIGALDTPTSGSYILNGQDISSHDENKLAEIRNKEIGFVFQSFNLLARTTVYRNVSLPLLYSNLDPELRKERIESSLRAAGMPEDRWQYFSNQLSGGQMQRVAIARALVNDPAVILADEPTGNLDTKTGELVLNSFQLLNKEQGRTIVLITHELSVAEYADRIIRITDGMIQSDIQNTHKH